MRSRQASVVETSVSSESKHVVQSKVVSEVVTKSLHSTKTMDVQFIVHTSSHQEQQSQPRIPSMEFRRSSSLRPDSKGTDRKRTYSSSSGQGTGGKKPKFMDQTAEECVGILKQIYKFMDIDSIRDIVHNCAGQMSPTHSSTISQGLLMEMSSQRIRGMLGEAAGFTPSATCASADVTSVRSRQDVPCDVNREDARESEQDVSSQFKPKLHDTDKNNNRVVTLTKDHSASGDSVVPVTGKVSSTVTSQVKPAKSDKYCHMRYCGCPVTHIKRHIVVRHLPVSFASWKAMPQSDRIRAH